MEQPAPTRDSVNQTEKNIKKMNFQTAAFLTPLRVMMINPLVPASHLIITKMLSGIVFGKSQLIDLILLVYANEINSAHELAQELASCAFPCYNKISITSDLPCLTDADVFCFITNFTNPNSLDFEKMDSDEQFDTFYLIIKIATSLGKPVPVKEPEDKKPEEKKVSTDPEKEKWKPIIVGDGILVIDILMTIAKNIPAETFFCATPLRSIAKTVLSDYLKIECYQINHAYIWAANDIVFHSEIGTPYLKHDKVNVESNCDWDAISPEMLEALNMEHIQFNASWMKREFIERMVTSSSSNPYGCIYKAAEMSKTLRHIWKPRYIEDAVDSTNTSLGVISDGSLGTIKGLAYVLPLIITKNSYKVDTRYEETSHLRHEIKRINAAVKEHHEKLAPYCKKFLEENVIKKAFIPVGLDSESETTYSSLEDSESSERVDF